MNYPITLALITALSPLSQGQCRNETTVSTVSLRFDGIVALDGDLLAATQRVDTAEQTGQGQVALYSLSPSGSAELVARISPPGGFESPYFGTTLALNGTTLAVASFASDFPYESRVFLYEMDPNDVHSWHLVSEIALGETLLWDMDLADDTLVLGFSDPIQSGVPGGNVQVHERDHGGPDAWGLRAQLSSSSPQDLGWFGDSVAVSGDTIFVGAPGESHQYPQQGAVYVFERALGGPDGWGLHRQLFATNPGPLDNFGAEGIDVDGDTAVVNGRYGPQGNRVVVLERHFGSPFSWGERQVLTVESPTWISDFGASLALDGDRLLVGDRSNSAGPSFGGEAYEFGRNEGGADAWGLVSRIVPSYSGEEVYFGSSVAVSGSRTVAGGVSNLLTVYEDCQADTYCLAGANSVSPSGASIEVSGSARVSSNSLVLNAGPAPDGQPGLFYYGTGSLMIPFGDGYQCVGGALYRLPIAVAAGGVHNHELDISSPPAPGGQITAGSTWNFQAWYRDPAGASAFNLSDAVGVTFLP